MIYGTGKLWKAAAALLLALVVSLGTLGVAQASHRVSDAKPGWYKVGGSAADRMLAKGGGVIATLTRIKLNKDYSWRAYWTVKNKSSSPQKVGCAGYQNYGLKGYKVKVFYHKTFNYKWSAKDAKCVHLGGAYRQTLEPGQTITSWAAFKYSGKKGTCTELALPTGPKVPEHVGYTKCVDPYARHLGKDQGGGSSVNNCVVLPLEQIWYEPNDAAHVNHCGPGATQVALDVRLPVAQVPNIDTLATEEHTNTKGAGTYMSDIVPVLNHHLNTNWYNEAHAKDQKDFEDGIRRNINNGYAVVTGVMTPGMPGWGNYSAKHIVAIVGFCQKADGTKYVSYVDTASPKSGYNGTNDVQKVPLSDFWSYVSGEGTGHKGLNVQAWG